MSWRTQDIHMGYVPVTQYIILRLSRNIWFYYEGYLCFLAITPF